MKTIYFFLILSIFYACKTENNSKNNVGNTEKSLKTLEKYNLPQVLEETSGLALINDTLWTLNDSGNEAALYAISKKGELLEKRSTSNINIDWEDMTNSKGKIIIADVGNNYGTRKNLYLIDYDLSNGNANSIDSIPFYYPEQENFSFQQATPFDAEGLIFIDDKIVLFTKNRSTLTTELYEISSTTKIAKKVGSLNVGSLITGADYHQKSKTLVLTGYGKNRNQYLYVINDFSLSTLSNLKINQYKIDYYNAQIEAVAIINPDTFWITSEQTQNYTAFLAKVKIL